jgi:hypothetical protein
MAVATSSSPKGVVQRFRFELNLQAIQAHICHCSNSAHPHLLANSLLVDTGQIRVLANGPEACEMKQR